MLGNVHNLVERFLVNCEDLHVSRFEHLVFDWKQTFKYFNKNWEENVLYFCNDLLKEIFCSKYNMPAHDQLCLQIIRNIALILNNVEYEPYFVNLTRESHLKFMIYFTDRLETIDPKTHKDKTDVSLKMYNFYANLVYNMHAFSMDKQETEESLDICWQAISMLSIFENSNIVGKKSSDIETQRYIDQLSKFFWSRFKAKLDYLIWDPSPDTIDDYDEDAFQYEMENYCKLSEVITMHFKIFKQKALPFATAAIRSIMEIRTLSMKHLKARLLCYWMSDLYRFLGEYLADVHIPNNWETYTAGNAALSDPNEDYSKKKNLIGDLGFLTMLTTYEETFDSQYVVMPYTDSLRYMAINYLYHNKKLTKRKRMDALSDIINALLDIR